MMVFCLSFGLSMDYELFLLFRIKREYAHRSKQRPRHRRRASWPWHPSSPAPASSWPWYSAPSSARSCRC